MSFGFKYMNYLLPDLVPISLMVNDLPNPNDTLERIQSGGLSKIPADNDLLLTELINKAVNDFFIRYELLRENIKKIYLVHSLPFLSPANYPFFEHCFNGLNLENIPKVALSGQPCAILHFATFISGLELNDYDNINGILIIGADKAYTNNERIFFNSAMGDAVFIGFLTKSSRDNLILSSFTQTNVIAYQGENSDKDQIASFRAANPSFIRLAIETALEKANLKIQDIKFIVPHTPYTQIWNTISILMNIPRDKFLTRYISETGHLNSNDSFIHYIRAVNENFIVKNDIVLLINPAFGGTRGVTIIKR